ncbi:MAG: hypothetical protein IPM45_09210 [Acidimicrobiales bacterium]|nr:hypothetical protein [Acidimicrobiales bacterium]
MAVRWLARPARKPSPDEVRARLGAVVADSFPDRGLVVGDDPETVWLAWRDGPAPSIVRDAVGDLSGWAWLAVAPDVEAPPAGAGRPNVVWARRSYSERALATAVVRFHASRGRHATMADERDRELVAALLDEDDPAVSGYPIVDAIVDRLLEAPDPDPDPAPAGGPGAIERLSARLRYLGYDNLWGQAYQQVT